MVMHRATVKMKCQMQRGWQDSLIHVEYRPHNRESLWMAKVILIQTLARVDSAMRLAIDYSSLVCKLADRELA
jgi:hypothetical protein